MKKIIVVFKTHLDIGFTDFSKTVVERYMNEYIPNALRVAREMRGEKERFIWTTGSWLIEKYLEEGKEKELLKEAIKCGEIRWHGLPFTTHTELMDQGLFSYGLSISKKLDKRFGMNTIAAKMTDVPGHTKAMIPLLHQAGIRFLHIGVNPASTGPDVPDLFRWRADSGEEIVVMYNADYGKMTEIGNSGVAVYFAHTGDNRGPQSAEKIREIYEELHREYPEAEVAAGTLEDIAQVAMEQDLEVVTKEIGDTWIHGAGSDPKKVNQYRGLLRLAEKVDLENRERIYKKLLLIPEHTWGLDEKMWLGTKLENGELVGEHHYFEKQSFLVAKKTEKFRRMEKSWQEQRNYLQEAVEGLEDGVRSQAESVMQEVSRELTDLEGYEPKETGKLFAIGSYGIMLDETGAIAFLTKGKKVLADSVHKMGEFVYEVFSKKEYDRFQSQYVTSKEIWALEDNGKIGVEEAVSEYRRYKPEAVQVWKKGRTLVIRWKLPKEAYELYGGMELAELKVEFGIEKILFDFAWFKKHESRVPEAMWLRFCPRAEIQWIQKMGENISPLKVVSKGARRLHAVQSEVMMDEVVLRTIDAPLVHVGELCTLQFTDQQPETDKGVYVNLYNNLWGTNFPMWYGEDARFRFELNCYGNEDIL